MTNSKTLAQWRPHPLVFLYCTLAIVLLGGVCFWGTKLLVSQWYQPEVASKAALHGRGVVNPFVLVVTTEMLYACPASFSRTATNYRLYDDWGRKFLFAFCDPGSSLRHCFHHCDRSCESLSEGYCLCSKPLPPTSGVLPEASHVPVRMTPPDIIAMITCSKIPTALIEPWPDSSVNDTRPPKLSFC